MSVTPISATPPKPLRVWTYKDVEAPDVNPQKWLWQGMLPSTGIALLYGAPYTFKSTLVAALGAAMDPDARQQEIAGRTVEPGAMVLAALEHSDDDVRVLIKEAAKGAGLPYLRDVTVIRPPFDLFDDGNIAELEAIAQRTNARVIVFDSLRRTGAFGEDKSDDVATVHRILQPFAERRLVLLVHHPTHGTNRPRGSLDWSAISDVEIRATATGDVLTLAVKNHRSAPMTIPLLVVHTDGAVRFEQVSSGIVESDPAVEKVIFEAVQDTPGINLTGLKEKMAAAKKAGAVMKCSRDAVEAALRALIERKQVRNTGTGQRGSSARYFAVEGARTTGEEGT